MDIYKVGHCRNYSIRQHPHHCDISSGVQERFSLNVLSSLAMETVIVNI